MSDEIKAKNDERRLRKQKKKYAPEGSRSQQVKREELNNSYKSVSEKIWKKINQGKS
mgnify:CR=1 FL=1